MSDDWTIEQLDDRPRQSLFAGVEYVNVAGERASFAHAWFEKGTQLPSPSQATHHHGTEEIVYVVRGALRVRVGHDPDNLEHRVVGAGEVFVLPANLPHGAEVLEDTEAFSVNSPVRADHIAAPIVES